MTAEFSFLPETIRPKPKVVQRPKVRHRLRFAAVALALSAASAGLASWRIETVLVESCPGLPTSAVDNLRNLSGTWVPSVDLEWVRLQAERWPGVAFVEVSIHLPGTLKITTGPDHVSGSMRVGEGWRAVSDNGAPGRSLPGPRGPVFIGFDAAQNELRRALAVGRRFACDGEAEITEIRRLTPTDYEVRLVPVGEEERRSTVRVGATKSAAEDWWLAAFFAAEAPPWADLRHPDRVVIGGVHE